MSTSTFSVPLGSVDLGKLESDADYHRLAHQLLPDALTRIGEKAAEVAWTELQKSIRGIPGFKGNSSSSDKSRFIREGGRNHARSASSHHRREVEKHIREQLRKMKRTAE